LENQLYIFGIFILSGIFIGIIFDAFRIIRKNIKSSDLFTFIQDFTCSFLYGLVLLYCIFRFNNGEIRLYIFSGTGIGITLYLLIFSSIFRKIGCFIINILKQILRYILFFPFKFIFKLTRKILFKPISFFIINFGKSLSKIKIIFKKKNNNKENLTSKKDLI